MAEAPAAAPANTKDTLLEKLENIKALIKKTFDEKEPRGNDTASLAVHAAHVPDGPVGTCFDAP